MASERIFEFDIPTEINRVFDSSSIPTEKQPRAVVLIGGVGTGKTSFRRSKYSRGYVLIDAGDIFLSLTRGEYLPFPGPLGQAVDALGQVIAERAISERRHIVTEIIGAENDLVEGLTNAMSGLDYQVEVALLTCAPEEAVRRNELRNPEEGISAHYSETFQTEWLGQACAKATEEQQEFSKCLTDQDYLKRALLRGVLNLENDNLKLLGNIELTTRRWSTAGEATELRGLVVRLRDIGFEYLDKLDYDHGNFALRMAVVALQRIVRQRPDLTCWLPDVLTSGLSDYIRHPMALDGCDKRSSHIYLKDAIEALYHESLQIWAPDEQAGWREQWRNCLEPDFWVGYYDRYGW
jgi:hypothetical protein